MYLQLNLTYNCNFDKKIFIYQIDLRLPSLSDITPKDIQYGVNSLRH